MARGFTSSTTPARTCSSLTPAGHGMSEPTCPAGCYRDRFGIRAASRSPDGKQLSGTSGPEDKDGIFTYEFASRRFTRLSDRGEPWNWLNDGRRLLYTYHQKLFVVDSVSKKSHELLVGGAGPF